MVVQSIFCRVALDHDQRIFNYRLLCARCIIENSFGILAATWRLYQRPLALQAERVKSVVKATFVLQNLIQTHHQCAFTPDSDDQDGSWWQLASHGIGSLTGTGRLACREAKQVREKFNDYFNTVGQVPWQERMIGNFFCCSIKYHLGIDGTLLLHLPMQFFTTCLLYKCPVHGKLFAFFLATRYEVY